MKSLNSKRRRSLKKFFKGLDRIALGFFDRNWKRDRWKEEQEAIAIAELIKSIKGCGHCGSIPLVTWKSNFEYPDDVSICCKCGLQTKGFVEFVSLNPTQPKQQSYSKLESVKKAVELWNSF